MNGNSASKEEEIWKFLSILSIYDGNMHFIFGDSQEAYHPRFDAGKLHGVPAGVHQWSYTPQVTGGPRPQTETTKMQVLQFLSKTSDTVSPAFPPYHEEAVRVKEERAQARAWHPEPVLLPRSEVAPGPCSAATLTLSEVKVESPFWLEKPVK